MNGELGSSRIQASFPVRSSSVCSRENSSSSVGGAHPSISTIARQGIKRGIIMARDNPPPALGQSPKSNRSPQRRTGSPKRLKVKGQITAHAEHFLPFEFVIDRVSSRTQSTLIEVGTDRWAGRSIKATTAFSASCATMTMACFAGPRDNGGRPSGPSLPCLRINPTLRAANCVSGSAPPIARGHRDTLRSRIHRGHP